jgi:hypothetical protein
LNLFSQLNDLVKPELAYVFHLHGKVFCTSVAKHCRPKAAKLPLSVCVLS